MAHSRLAVSLWVVSLVIKGRNLEMRDLKIALLLGAMLAALLFSTGTSIAAPLSGAIFTTTPDGVIVNENTHYERKIEVYLDGGPGPNAPQTAAGLPDGNYYFQVTDPPGKVLLSEDPAKCREIRVQDGVIVELVSIGRTYGNGSKATPCSVQDPPAPPNGLGVAGPSGRHDTNVDSDHGPPAIVVQLMPFFDTPNPGGVYKAWIIPVGRYVANGGNPAAVPQVYKVKGVQIGYQRDPGFGPPRDQVKTDNFKVKEFLPPEVTVRKFHDVDGDGIWDSGEPEIGVDQCVNTSGNIVSCPGGWPYMWTAPVDGGTVTDGPFYTPGLHLAAVPGTYTACEILLLGWAQMALYVDGLSQPLDLCGDVVVAGTSGEKHEIVFGDTRPGEVSGHKVIDYDADGVLDPEDVCPSAAVDPINHPGCAGVSVYLVGTDNLGNSVNRTTLTDDDGYYEFTGVMPGSYVVSVGEPAGFYCSYPDPCNWSFPVLSGEAVNDLNFGDYSLAEVSGVKFFDRNGNGEQDAGEEGIPDVEIHLDGTDGQGNEVHLLTLSCGGAVDCAGEPVGTFRFSDLVPGDYEITEVTPAGFVQIWPEGGHSVVLTSDEVCTDNDFANFGPCDGLTPGYWSNWRNHYTEGQFLPLLQGTVAAGNVALADDYLSSVGCDADDALHCMRRFLLANQLTLNLTQHSELPNPDDAGLVGLCRIEGIGTLQSAISDALAILARPLGFSRDEILVVKNRLAAFAELNG
ncbi:MAG: hypothetical protein A2Z24_00405 [Candidatus Woykebacteria bacterium RBG_16_44_10]|uniref:SD-repeat containing protein B domain-containing protein n=1 Tax=Candidatus Woykebacteria bacterium RBG_16_44_10 TaxID=1802597 RepID=A0A1G1WG92_9BACT|nr:MAG: hypothetical protein A2Z24_00405 [Candidatus Woykebacteria bacterium RBG_16_44_10]